MRLPVRARVIVLRGEAGIGKSALLGYVADRDAGWHVARAVGVDSEMELAFAGSSALRADDGSPRPAARPERDALATVFGLSAGPRRIGSWSAWPR